MFNKIGVLLLLWQWEQEIAGDDDAEQLVGREVAHDCAPAVTPVGLRSQVRGCRRIQAARIALGHLERRLYMRGRRQVREEQRVLQAVKPLRLRSIVGSLQ